MSQPTIGGPVVGFDLDLTLVDSAPGIVATVQAALEGTGEQVAAEQIWPYIGYGLEQMLQDLVPAVDPAQVAARYRELYPEVGIPSIRLLPGAREALAAVHALGGRVLVVSMKVEPAVRAVLAAVGLDGADPDGAGPDGAGPDGAGVDEVAGGLFGAAKGARLLESGADVYVGDHPGDLEAARVASAAAVAVATGPHSAQALAAAGADVVLTDLRAFPQWLSGYWAGRHEARSTSPRPEASSRP